MKEIQVYIITSDQYTPYSFRTKSQVKTFSEDCSIKDITNWIQSVDVTQNISTVTFLEVQELN